jgi:hypothetical protein
MPCARGPYSALYPLTNVLRVKPSLVPAAVSIKAARAGLTRASDATAMQAKDAIKDVFIFPPRVRDDFAGLPMLAYRHNTIHS